MKFKGGLGNQLFQYAATRRLALANNLNLCLDTLTGFRGDPFHRAYVLNQFSICATELLPADLLTVPLKARLVGQKWRFRELFRLRLMGKAFDERFFEWRCGGPAYLEGYWHSERYFRDIKETLRSDLHLRADLSPHAKRLLQDVSCSNSVAVHVRRYGATSASLLSRVSAPTYADPGQHGYYARAFEEIGRRVANPILFVFSHDVDWAKTKINTRWPTVFVEDELGPETSDVEAFSIMRQCSNHIIANSTFSWWAAWLRVRDGGTVIFPAKWFDGGNRKAQDLRVSGWTSV